MQNWRGWQGLEDHWGRSVGFDRRSLQVQNLQGLCRSLGNKFGKGLSWKFRRGFMIGLLCGSQGLLACQPALQQITPIEQLVIPPPSTNSPATTAETPSSPTAIADQTVTIRGQVMRQVPLVQGSVYELQDATGSIWIQTQTPLPPADVQARLTLDVQGKPRSVQTVEPSMPTQNPSDPPKNSPSTPTSTPPSTPTSTPTSTSKNLTLVLVEVDRQINTPN